MNPFLKTSFKIYGKQAFTLPDSRITPHFKYKFDKILN